MAGKRHHFIPQFLQRGFAGPRDSHNAWVFHKERLLNTNIKNIALEGQFYAHEGDTSVDDKITDNEGALAAFVKELRAADDAASVNPQRAAELVTHVLVRTRHLRENFQRTNEQLLEKVYSALADPKTLVAVMDHHLQTDDNLTRLVRERLSWELANAGVPRRQRAEALEALLPAFVERAKAELPAGFRQDAVAQAKALRAEGKIALESPLLQQAVKRAQLKALRLGTPTARQEAFAKLKFQVRKFAGGDIILGDSVAVYAVAGERKVAPLNDGTMPMLGVLLPLDPETCLVGELDQPCESFTTAESIRRSVAECSLEFFLAHRDSPENRQLVADIGKRAHLLSEDDMDEIMRGLKLSGNA